MNLFFFCIHDNFPLRDFTKCFRGKNLLLKDAHNEKHQNHIQFSMSSTMIIIDIFDK